MKNYNYIVSITFLIALVGFGFSNQNTISKGSLGDVKYSILPPEQFKKLNGNGWQWMDGSDIDKTDLHDFLIAERLQGILTNGKKLPNANGMFIRSMGFQNGIASDNRDRKVGSIQDYGTKLPKSKFQGSGNGKTSTNGEHSHDTTLGWGGGPKNEGKIRTSSNSPKNMWGGEIKKSGKHYHNYSMDNIKIRGGDNETRPKNIAFYAYIKVNE